MRDDRDYLWLKAVYEYLNEKKVPPSAEELLNLYAQTTGNTVEKREGLSVLEDLKRRDYIEAEFIFDGLVPADAQAITITALGEQVLNQNEKKKQTWLTENRKWAIGITISLIIALGLIPSFRSCRIERNALRTLHREFQQNTKILHDITYDKQYQNGTMGAQLWNISFTAYDTALSRGAIGDAELADDLRKIYTGIFKVADNALLETRRANTAQQIRLYKLIGENYKRNESLLRETEERLATFAIGQRLLPERTGLVSGDTHFVSDGTVYRAELPILQKEEVKQEEAPKQESPK